MKVHVLALCLMSIAMFGCTTKAVKYGDAQAVESLSQEFGSTDLQMTAEKMVDSLLTFPPIVQVINQRRPVIFVESIKNKSMEHIDTESITDTIATKILRSGKFRFVDMTKVDEVRKQLDYQQGSGMVDEAKAMQMGRQIGAEYMLYGNLSSIVKRSGDYKDVYYKITLKLMHLETGLLEWQDEKEIRKVARKRILGI